MISLSHDQELRSFEDEIIALIAQSELSQAENRVREAIGLAGSVSLKAVSDVPVDSVQFEGWRVLCADLAEADDELYRMHGEHVKLILLKLENDPSIPRLQFERYFHTNYSRAENGYIFGERNYISMCDRPIYVSGLEALMTVQRTPWPRFDAEEGLRRQFAIDHLIAGLLLVTRIHQSFDRAVATHGLPLAVDVVIDTLPSKPYPLDYNDLGPHTRRFVAAQTIAVTSHGSVAELLAERQAEGACADQANPITNVSWTRAFFRRLFR